MGREAVMSYRSLAVGVSMHLRRFNHLRRYNSRTIPRTPAKYRRMGHVTGESIISDGVVAS
jgi:hypothetical protein